MCFLLRGLVFFIVSNSGLFVVNEFIVVVLHVDVEDGIERFSLFLSAGHGSYLGMHASTMNNS